MSRYRQKVSRLFTPFASVRLEIHFAVPPFSFQKKPLFVYTSSDLFYFFPSYFFSVHYYIEMSLQVMKFPTDFSRVSNESLRKLIEAVNWSRTFWTIFIISVWHPSSTEALSKGKLKVLFELRHCHLLKISESLKCARMLRDTSTCPHMSRWDIDTQDAF